MKLNKMQLTESYFKKHFPEIYKHVVELPPKKFQEKLYWYHYGLSDYPKCKLCGNPTTFKCFSQGYRLYCSRKCLNSDPAKIEKTKEVCLSKYGAIAPAGNAEVMQKMKNTNMERYGVPVAMQSKEIQERAKQTCRDKYGYEWNGAVPELVEKRKNTNQQKYGAITPFAVQELRDKASRTKLRLYGDENYNNPQQIKATQEKLYGGCGNASDILKEKFLQTRRSGIMSVYDFILGYTDDGDWICKCPHPECNKCEEKTFIISPKLYWSSRHHPEIETCTKLLPYQSEWGTGTTIELFIRNILDEYGIPYETNVKILDGLEIDVWVPSKNIGIEVNGTYFHSDLMKPKNYHINKFKIAKNKGIRLISIWSDQIYSKPDIVKSLLLTKLGCCGQSIYARKCEVREVNSKQAAKFLDANHIQGHTPTSVRLGLYYNNQLMSVMTFTQKLGCQGSKQKQEGEWVLNRFCNKLNARVVGGASKLLKYFISHFKPAIITSFSANDISDGGLYKTLGFESDEKINSSYFYVKNEHRWHRSTFTKDAIVARGWRNSKDGWTEKEVMDEMKFFRIYDSGTIKWIYKIKEEL